MRVLILGGTGFVGRRVAARLADRGDDVLLVHRGTDPRSAEVPGRHLRADRHALASHAGAIRAFGPQAVVDAHALTGADVDAVLPVLPEVPTVVLSSQDVYQAHAALRTGEGTAPVPLTEDAELRRDRYPYRGAGLERVPDDYEKLDVEEQWAPRGATVLRLPVVYGPHDWQRREDPVLRRVRAGRTRIPVGAGTLLFTRGHVDDVAAGVVAALDTRAADGEVLNLAEPRIAPIGDWLRRIAAAAGSEARLVRVPEHALPADLALSGSFPQHLLVSVARAERIIGWTTADPAVRVAESVRWHLAHPSPHPWTPEEAAADDAALAAADGWRP